MFHSRICPCLRTQGVGGRVVNLGGSPQTSLITGGPQDESFWRERGDTTSAKTHDLHTALLPGELKPCHKSFKENSVSMLDVGNKSYPVISHSSFYATY